MMRSDELRCVATVADDESVCDKQLLVFWLRARQIENYPIQLQIGPIREILNIHA